MWGYRAITRKRSVIESIHWLATAKLVLSFAMYSQIPSRPLPLSAIRDVPSKPVCQLCSEAHAAAFLDFFGKLMHGMLRDSAALAAGNCIARFNECQ
jgi:hypothetical protein